MFSKRVNWSDPQSPLLAGVGTYPVTVSRAYWYEGICGRVSERQTRVTLLTSHDAFIFYQDAEIFVEAIFDGSRVAN